MNKTMIRSYDDALLKKERGIKSANIVIFLMFLLYIIPTLAHVGATESTTGIWLPIFLFVLLAKINTNHLKHIASIKLYREKIEESQHPSGPYFRKSNTTS